MEKRTHNVLTVISQVPMFAELPKDTNDALARIAVQMRREAGEVIFFEGDPAPGLFLVTAGRVKIARTSATGREQILHIISPGEHFNMVPVFDTGGCPADATAMTDVSLLLFPQEALRTVVANHPPLAMALLAECSVRLRRLVNLVDDLALHTVQGRLARLLLDQAEAHERGEDLPPLSQADMAARLGTVREMVSRTLKVFESLGLVRVERGSIQLLDREGLAVQAEG